MISICIPTWEQHGHGRKFLRHLLTTVRNQTFVNYEVVVSDHSVSGGIHELLTSEFSDMPITYVKNIVDRGNGPANTNNSLKYAKGDIIKVMFQDDFFVDNGALQLIHDTFTNTNCGWLVNGCNHTNDGKTFYREMVPSWNDRVVLGENSISSPSVLSFRNENMVYFDESLVMLMDCEYYYQLFLKYGEPFIISNILISNRTHKHQISSMYTKSLSDEIQQVKIKHKI